MSDTLNTIFKKCPQSLKIIVYVTRIFILGNALEIILAH